MARYIREDRGAPISINKDEKGYYWEDSSIRYDTLEEAVKGYDYDRYFFKDTKRDEYRHRTPLKCFLNPILRKLQLWTDNPYVIASKVTMYNNYPMFDGYVFRRVKYERK